jgi:hypothetical protein
MILLLLLVIIIICTIFYFQKDNGGGAYTCGVDEEPDYRAVGILKKDGFQPGQTVNLAFQGDTSKATQTLIILKKYAFPYINLNFQIGRTGDSVITINVNPKGPTANINGNTTGIGTKNPVISIYKLEQGVVLHEFGHAMGLFHEHQNPSQNNPIVWDKNQVYAHYIEKKHWKKDAVDSQILNRRNTAKSLYTPWDSKSIMNYNIQSGLTSAPVKIFVGQEYSDGDKSWFKLKYGIKTK